MSDQPKPNRPLSEISHLFLSSVRDKQTGGSPRPVRKPPQPQTDHTDDLTPEEYAHVFGDVDAPASAERPAHAPPVTAIISSHLNGRQFDRIKDYARHLCELEGRIGLIEVDASEFRVMCFDRGVQENAGPESPIETFDPRQMAASIDELNFDIDHWLIALPNPRTPEARAIIRDIDHWVLLSTCDHDGVVAAYRTLKGFSEAHRPRLSLGILDASNEIEVGRVFRKLSGVCQQFLDWPLEPEPAVAKTDQVAEHLVMLCRPTRDKAQLATAPQWQVVSNFVAKLKSAIPANSNTPAENVAPHQSEPIATHAAASVSRRAEVATPANSTLNQLGPAPSHGSAPRMGSSTFDSGIGEIVDLPNNDASDASIISTILAQSGGEFVECPIRPPASDSIRLVVSRERGLILIAVARQGLEELRAVGLAYRWLIENRALVAMALPQFSIDALRLPRVHLLVDQSDANAEALQPLLQTGNVTVRTYRTLRWGEKLGLLLDAA